MDKDRGGMDIYPQKQHLKWHENMKQHVGLFQKFGIARAQDESQGAKREKSGQVRQNPILDPVGQ